MSFLPSSRYIRDYIATATRRPSAVTLKSVTRSSRQIVNDVYPRGGPRSRLANQDNRDQRSVLRRRVSLLHRESASATFLRTFLVISLFVSFLICVSITTVSLTFVRNKKNRWQTNLLIRQKTQIATYRDPNCGGDTPSINIDISFFNARCRKFHLFCVIYLTNDDDFAVLVILPFVGKRFVVNSN